MAVMHRAAVLVKVGEALVQQDVETPQHLEPYEVLVRVHATAINPIDYMMRDVGFYVPTTPHVLGFDAAGVVEVVGSAVVDRRVGQRVLFCANNTLGPAYGSFQEKAKVWSASTILIPDGMSFKSAATVPIAYQTAACCAVLALGLPLFEDVAPASAPIVVLGGASSVGLNALQLFRAFGYTKLITTASPRNWDLVRSFGATDVVDRSASAQEIVELAGGKVPYVFDAISIEQTQRLAASVVVPREGKVALTQQPIAGIDWPIEPPVFTNSFRYLDAPSPAPGKGKNPADWEFGLRANAWLERALAAGRIVGTPVETVSDIEVGLNASKKGVSGIKLVVEM